MTRESLVAAYDASLAEELKVSASIGDRPTPRKLATYALACERTNLALRRIAQWDETQRALEAR